MPQETNLNVAPYFDDFDPNSNYYKVLFKPGFPVQARELTGLQSILQNQVEEMGNHFFKEGAKIIPGDLTYVRNFYGIQIEPEFLGIPVGIYLDQLVGTTITGASSGVTARVVTYITDQQSERGVYTLYVNYENNSTTDADPDVFSNSEILLTSTNITYASTFISSGEGFATSIPQGASIIGSSFNIADGIYFLRGYFVKVKSQTLILDQYSNTPSYRVGLDVVEEIISSDVDPRLNDNAQGFNNFTAPGADRLKITATLSKKGFGSFDESNFVQLSEVKDGVLRLINKNTDYNFLGQEFARRTFDESGNYYVKEFVTTVKDSLNNQEGNRGIYNANQTTQSGSTPSPDLGIYRVSPGKAYVRGFEVETIAPTLIDFNKPRTTNNLEDQSVNFGFDPQLNLNRVTGSATIGINTSLTLSLRSDRVGVNSLTAPGSEIGLARVYDFVLESGAYDVTDPNTNRWDLSMFDTQLFTSIQLNEPVTLNVSTFIKGESSGAKGYLKNAVSNGTDLVAYNVEGNFFKGERLLFNGVLDNARFVVGDRNFSMNDVKSVFGIVGTAATFTGDTIQTINRNFGSANVSADNAGESLISIPADLGFSFIGIVSTGNIIRYSRPGLDIATLNKVIGVGKTNITVQAVATVNGVCDGALPTGVENVQNFELLQTRGTGGTGSGNLANNEAIFSIFPNANVSQVDLIGSDLIIRKQFTTSISVVGGQGSTPTINAGDKENFLPFDEERYTLIRSDGATEVLTEDRLVFTNGNKSLTINGLTGGADTQTKLITTIKKSDITSKTKLRNISQSVIIDKSSKVASGTGATTLNDGLVYGDFPFGTRVQDEEISLNVPDVYNIYGIFESNSVADPTSPFMDLAQLDGISGTTNDLIIGETMVGKTSGAKAIYLEKKSDTSVYFCYLNSSTFSNAEVVTFQSSSVNGISANVKLGSQNISNDFKFFNGQKGTFYDYSRIIRRSQAQAPSRKIRIYYASSSYDPADAGDITTVNSYVGYEYGSEIQSVQGIRNSDIIDARPRVADYSVVAGARSPFEFEGRNFFNTNQQSSPHVIASDESVTLGYNYYLPRVDRIFIDRFGALGVVAGTPDDVPRLPDSLSNVMNVANVYLPAYLYNVSDANVQFIDHKRYQMSDISKLEQRIKNLEYYTSLSQLETSTINQFVADANGNNRFKAGVFVDNFTSTDPQDLTVGVRNSVDVTNGILRPAHYTTALNLQLGSTAITGIGTTSDANQDANFSEVVGANVKRTDSVISLDYVDELWLQQPFATRVENVTPFLVQFWQGDIQLVPEVDVWIDVQQLDVNAVMMEGSFRGVAEALNAEITSAADGSRSGVSPILWNSWQTVGVDVDLSLSSSSSSSQNSSTVNSGTSNTVGNRGGGSTTTNTNTATTTTDTTVTTTTNATVGVNLNQTRDGRQFFVNEQIDTESLGDRVVRREIINFMRTRNISVIGTRFRPYTRVYSFFDDVDVNNYVSPKLLEIEMINGTFQVDEAVFGAMNDGGSEVTNGSTIPAIRFRVAQLNHKYGPYNNPTDFYDSNPYNRNVDIPNTYSASSTLLNVDTFSLQSQDAPEFSGWVSESMILTGETSGAQARITAVRMISDRVGTVIGSYFVPNPENPANPTFETGRSTFRLTSSSINSAIEGVTTTAGEQTFYSQGDVDVTQEVTLSLRNATVRTEDFTQSRTIGDTASSSTTSSASFSNTSQVTTVDVTVNPPPPPPPPDPDPPRPPRPPQIDPLAQSFSVDDEQGVFITGVEVFFQSKDENIPVLFEIRETNLGTPTSTVLPFSQVSIDPGDITISEDGSIPTRIDMRAPVFLNGQTEYALVLLSQSTEYRVWISRLGEADVTTSTGTEAGQVLVTEQPLLGSLFKSQNASVWTPSQYEDLKFNLYVANFVPQGSVSFFNPPLPTALSQVDPNGLTIKSREIRIGIGTTVSDPDLTIGNTVLQQSIGATGTLVGLAGSVTGNFTITNAGVGYTPSAAAFTYTGVALTSITGEGINATADITITNGNATAAAVNAGGSGYVVGDVLTPVTVGNVNLGSGIQLSVDAILGNNTLVLDDVQGNFVTNSAYPLYFVNNSGITTELNAAASAPAGGDVIPQSPIGVVNEGNYIKVFQRNHGLYSNVNRTVISEVRADTVPTTLAQDYGFNTTSFITFQDEAAEFDTFENLGVGGTNPGYIKVGQEIISYTGINGRTLTGITRGVDNTVITNHSQGELVYKYQLDGVSLRRINTTHLLANVNQSELNEPAIGLDYYYVDVRMNANGTNRAPGNAAGFPPLYFNTDKTAGGPFVKAQYNLPFNLITPKVTTISPLGTNIIPQARTITAASVDGNQESYLDAGYKKVTIFNKNYFNDMMMIASPENEAVQLSDQEFAGKKSFQMAFTLTTNNPRLSPMIDLENASVVFTMNRVNQPVSDYVANFAVTSTEDDPNRFFYVSKNIILENPATSLRVQLDAYCSTFNDVRVFYALDQNGPVEETIFVPFPGFKNIGSNGAIIDISQNNGTPDIRVPKVDQYNPEPLINEYKEYTFSIDEVKAFRAFRVKIIGTSTNMANVPMIRSLRATAFA